MTQPAPSPTARDYSARTRSTETFGRVLCSVRQHHYIIDGPVQNGCPGEEVTPAELFLSAVGACGVELVQVIAREDGLPRPKVAIEIVGTVDRARQKRTDATTFSRVRMSFRVGGLDQGQAAALVAKFQKR